LWGASGIITQQFPILLFTRNGVDDAPTKLQQKLAVKFLQLNLDANTLPAKILFYTHGVKLACG
jgi:hypothetical protein